MLVTCAQCSTEFRAKPREKRKFCGHACYRAYEAVHGRPNLAVTPVDLTCKQCGGTFHQNPGEHRAYQKTWGQVKPYCSRACSNESKKLPADKWQASCTQCGKEMPIQRKPGGTINRLRKLCSSECRKAYWLAFTEKQRPSSEREIQRNVTKQGYVRLRFPNQNGVKGREVLEHRLVMEQHLGRPLRPDETVHHRVKPTTNNALDNLELFSSRHGPGQRVSEQITWAIAILTDYPEFARAVGVELVMRQADHQAA